jgi:hypothetical protein
MLARFHQIRAIGWAAHRHFAFRAATDGADLAANAGAIPARAPLFADDAEHLTSVVRRYHEIMSVSNLFFKVEVEHDAEETPERIGAEIRRLILRFYGVREVELSNYTTVEE